VLLNTEADRTLLHSPLSMTAIKICNKSTSKIETFHQHYLEKNN